MDFRSLRRLRNVAVLVGLALVLSTAVAIPMTAADDSVKVLLTDSTDLPKFDWDVTPRPGEVFAGRIVFRAVNRNLGPPDHNHEFVVIKTDLAPDALPRLGPGLGVDETQVEVLGRTSVLSPGEGEKLKLRLKPGNYVLVCNQHATGILHPSHYDNGMYSAFTVAPGP